MRTIRPLCYPGGGTKLSEVVKFIVQCSCYGKHCTSVFVRHLQMRLRRVDKEGTQAWVRANFFLFYPELANRYNR